MNHPTREEWMSYLYDELTTEEHSNLAAHLAVCPDCKVKVGEWGAVRKELNAWPLSPNRAPVLPTRPMIRWAAAAAIVLAAGFGIGRLTSATPDTEKVRAAIEPQLRQQLRREIGQSLRDELDRTSSAALAASSEQTKQLFAEFAKIVEARRAEDVQAIYTALDKLDSQRVTDLVSLKKDLDTVAWLTDAGLRRTHQQLVQLADYTEPAGVLNSPKNQK